jgi:hypothetical protein
MPSPHIPQGQSHLPMALAPVEYPDMPSGQSSPPPAGLGGLNDVARLATWLRSVDALVRTHGRRLSSTVRISVRNVPALPFALATALVVGVAGIVAIPPATALIPSPRDPVTDRIARIEERTLRQDETLQSLTRRLEDMVGDQALLRADAARFSHVAATADERRRSLEEGMSNIQGEVQKLSAAVADLVAQRTADDTQLAAALTRITNLADSLAAALSTGGASPTPSLGGPGAPRNAATSSRPPQDRPQVRGFKGQSVDSPP